MSLPTVPAWALGDPITSSKLQQDSDALTYLLYRAYGTYTQVTSAQSIADDTAVAVEWNSNIRQHLITHSTSSNPERITPNEPGLYLVTATVQFASNATGYRKLWFTQNGGSGSDGSVQVGASGSGETSLSTSAILYFDGIDDYLEVKVRHTKGSALSLGFGEFNPRLSLMWQSGLV